MKKIFLILITLHLIVACSNNPPASPTISPENLMNTSVAIAWTSLAGTSTANAPTNTFTPPPPTNTPHPTITSTPAPEPIILTGTGDSIIEANKWNSAALVKITYTGQSNFVVRNLDANNQPIDLLVNTIGSYTGSQILDIYDDDHTQRFEIKASGIWEIQILPLSNIRQSQIPGIITGVGDDVVIIRGTGSPDTLKADASQSTSNFVVHALTDYGFELVFNEIAPYTGTALLHSSTGLLQIKATGPWSLEVTTR